MTVKAKVDAIDSFVRTLKGSGQWDDIQAACVMAGWTNLAGALYPLKGTAPTNSGFADSDLDAGIEFAERNDPVPLGRRRPDLAEYVGNGIQHGGGLGTFRGGP